MSWGHCLSQSYALDAEWSFTCWRNTEEKNKSLPAVRKENRMRRRALGEGGKLTQPLCCVMVTRLLSFSLLVLKLYIAHQVGDLLEKQHWTSSGYCKFGDQVGKRFYRAGDEVQFAWLSNNYLHHFLYFSRVHNFYSLVAS